MVNSIKTRFSDIQNNRGILLPRERHHAIEPSDSFVQVPAHCCDNSEPGHCARVHGPLYAVHDAE